MTTKRKAVRTKLASKYKDVRKKLAKDREVKSDRVWPGMTLGFFIKLAQGKVNVEKPKDD